MKKARLAVLIFTVTVPLVFLSSYFYEVTEIRKGTSSRMEAELKFNLERILDPKPWERYSPDYSADTTAIKALHEGYAQTTPPPSAKPTPKNENRPKFDPQVFEEFKKWKKKRIPVVIEHWLTRIRENPESIPLEIQKYVAQAKQQALDKTASQYQLLGVMLVGPLVLLGLVSAWVISPGLARSRLRLVAQVALAGWTVFVALLLAFTVKDAQSVWAEITQAIALWIAGVVPCLTILYWTREPRQ